MRKGLSWFVLLLLLVLVLGIAHAQSGKVTYVYTDPQGTPLAEADASGNITATFDYKPYGSQALGSPAASPGYTGHVNDLDTGLVYMQARYYDPRRGGFLSVDPVVPSPGSLHSFNRYGYANNNPMRYTDPDGRDGTEALGGLFAESWSFVTGNGFHGSQIVGALKDGYNGEGEGRVHAALQDFGTVTAVAGVAGIVKGGATLIVSRFAAKEAVEEGAGLASEASKSLGANPFKGKSAQEISRVLEEKGYVPKGPDPGAGRGTYVNPKTGRGYHIDAEHPAPKGPHVGVHRPRNMRDNMKPRDYPMGGQ